MTAVLPPWCPGAVAATAARGPLPRTNGDPRHAARPRCGLRPRGRHPPRRRPAIVSEVMDAFAPSTGRAYHCSITSVRRCERVLVADGSGAENAPGNGGSAHAAGGAGVWCACSGPLDNQRPDRRPAPIDFRAMPCSKHRCKEPGNAAPNPSASMWQALLCRLGRKARPCRA